eukprot:627038-Lingulodinium_polyedra.AAC.1
MLCITEEATRMHQGAGHGSPLADHESAGPARPLQGPAVWLEVGLDWTPLAPLPARCGAGVGGLQRLLRVFAAWRWGLTEGGGPAISWPELLAA